MPNTRSKGAPLLPYDLEFHKSIRKMVNARELEAQRHGLGLEAEINAERNVQQTAGINQPRPGAQQNAGINQPRAVDDNRGMEGLVPSQRQPIAPRGRAQHPAHMMYEEDDADLDDTVVKPERYV
uniref:Integrase core domain containing protein n=1 Tax=Solanum tuberosum TaxID=4113 RepID=M1DK35_SOLTU